MAKKKKDEAPKNKHLFLWGGSLLLVGLVLFHFWDVHHVRVPDELLGTWTTTAEQYQGKSFEIGPAIVSFSLGDGAASTGFIQDIQAGESGDEGTLYTILYSVNGQQQQISFYYSGNQIIHLKSRKDITWTKTTTD